MKTKTTFTTKKLVLAALLAALTIVGSYIRIKVPADLTGTSAFHLGNIMCAMCGILLGPWLGGLAAGLGSALYDILLDPSYISECWITFITKGAYGIAAGLVVYCGNKNWGYVKALLGTIAGALVYATLYLLKSYFYSGMLVGGLSAFLVYNFKPAKCFMGDTGSLFLGGAVCGLAFALDMPLVLILVGIIYIIETLSVILQVGYFKLTHGKRLFKMAPIHHHYEKCGWSEERIVFTFAGITIVACLVAWIGVSGKF